MNRQPFEKPPRWWSPKLSRRWIKLWRPFQKYQQHRKQRRVAITAANQRRRDEQHYRRQKRELRDGEQHKRDLAA